MLSFATECGGMFKCFQTHCGSRRKCRTESTSGSASCAEKRNNFGIVIYCREASTKRSVLPTHQIRIRYFLPLHERVKPRSSSPITFCVAVAKDSLTQMVNLG